MGTLIKSSFCVFNLVLPTYRPNFAQAVCSTQEVKHVWLKGITAILPYFLSFIRFGKQHHKDFHTYLLSDCECHEIDLVAVTHNLQV